MTQNDQIYAAGLFDGEGCICMTMEARGGFILMVQVCMRNPIAVDWLKDTFGGNRCTRQNKKYGEYPQWTLVGGSCKPFLEAIAPFVKVKRTQVSLALAYIATLVPPGYHIEAKTKLVRYRIKQLLTEANKGWEPEVEGVVAEDALMEGVV